MIFQSRRIVAALPNRPWLSRSMVFWRILIEKRVLAARGRPPWQAMALEIHDFLKDFNSKSTIFWSRLLVAIRPDRPRLSKSMNFQKIWISAVRILSRGCPRGGIHIADSHVSVHVWMRRKRRGRKRKKEEGEEEEKEAGWEGSSPILYIQTPDRPPRGCYWYLK